MSSFFEVLAIILFLSWLVIAAAIALLGIVVAVSWPLWLLIWSFAV
jgi:hypothetical protein